jgi:hypothetical protein
MLAEFHFQVAFAAIAQGLTLKGVGVVLLVLLGLFFLMVAVVVFAASDDVSSLFVSGALLSAGIAILFVFYGYTLRASQQDTSEVRGKEGEAHSPPPGPGAGLPPKKSDEASKSTPKPEEPKPEEPITVKSTTCLVKEVKTSEPRMSTAETAELLVTLSMPSNARECQDTVTVDAPTFGLGKEATQPVSIVRPQESHVVRWLLDPEKPGSLSIAVETKKDRELVPVAVTTPLGFTATWVQAGALISGAATVIFGVLAFLRRGR